MSSEVSIVHIVDDDVSFRTSVARLLRACGYEAVVYESATELLRAPPLSTRGCIVLDVQMPGLSGPQLQDQLVQLGSMLPIIFLTGHGDIPTSVKAIKSGAEDFLSKPVSKETLLEAVERALARYDLNREQHDRLSILRARVDKLTPREMEVFACGPWTTQQADCFRAGHVRANHQGAPPQYYGEARSSVRGRSRFGRRSSAFRSAH